MAKAGAKAEFVDFDVLAHTRGGPPAGADGNWHYSCFLQWPSWRNKKLESLPGNYFRDRLYGHPIEGLVMTEDSECGVRLLNHPTPPPLGVPRLALPRTARNSGRKWCQVSGIAESPWSAPTL